MSSEKIVIKHANANRYTVKYSEFDGEVDVTTYDSGVILDVTFSSRTKNPVSAKDLRNFPLNAVQILIDNQPNSAPARNRPKLDHPNGELSEKFMKSLATYYLDSLTRNERPLVAIAAATGAPHNTVARWVLKARKEGFLK